MSPSDLLLAAFTVDRRGKTARTERDYAELAAAYVAFGHERGHKAASHWAKKYGRTPQRWRMDLKRAKENYLDTMPDGSVGLTDDAWLLIYGDDFFDMLEVENAIEDTEDKIHRLENLGDGSTESAEVLTRLDRKARDMTRRYKTKFTRDMVRQAWLAAERKKLVSANSPLAE